MWSVIHTQLNVTMILSCSNDNIINATLLGVIETDFAFSKNQTDCYIQCQSFEYTLTTVINNMHVNWIGLGFLVADLGMLAIEIDFTKIKQIIILKSQIILINFISY